MDLHGKHRLWVMQHGSLVRCGRPPPRAREAMQKKVTEEGEKEKELYEKFMCGCLIRPVEWKMS